MSFNSSVLITSVGVAVIGAVLVHMLGIDVAPALTFSIGAIFAGLASAFIGNASEEGSTETTTLYVGNLPYRANEGSVRELFSEHGKVFSVRLLRDKQTGKRRGFGFVEIATADSKKAISALNDFEFQERALKVRLANDK
ncbi:MAG: RNA-binding protein [Gammaproteobacteria bacterium]|nr:RNA-binding protein [Gammaproteobacteria bacterium]